jgi:hypothetical protein
MLHAHVIAAMEEFLSGTFIHKITNSDELMKKLIETNLKLGKKLKDKKHKDRQMIVAKKYLNNLIFHKLEKTEEMYKQVLDIDFKNTDWLDTAIKVRHHCVHRAHLSIFVLFIF